MKTRALLPSGCALTALVLLTPLMLTSCSDGTPDFTENAYIPPSDVPANDADATAAGGDTNTANSGSSTSSSNSENQYPGDGSLGNNPGGTMDSFELSFVPSQAEQGRVVYDWNTERLEQSLTMEQDRKPETVEHSQRTRAIKTEIFAQGSTEAAERESFNQNNMPSGLLDILVVIDNSPSMNEEQVNLSTKLSPLLSYVTNSDWRIGVVTTDPNDGCLRSLITKSDSNQQSKFASAVMAGVRGTGNEQGIRQAVASLSGSCLNNQPWIRANSTLAILMVSDEDNCSDGRGCSGNAWNSSSYLMDYLRTIRQPGVNAKMYGLIWHPSMTLSQCGTAANKAFQYADVIAQTNGTYGAICDNDYTSTLTAISQNMSVSLQNQFALHYAPIPSTLKVSVNGVLQTSGYTLTGNVITFNPAPAAGATIDIVYNFNSSTPLSQFALTGNADALTLQVAVDGQTVPSQNYTYNSGTHTVQFYQAPAGREVQVSYREMGGLTTDFAFNGPVDLTSVAVSVNGMTQDDLDYQVLNSQGLVRFYSAPTDGAVVRITSIKSNQPRLSYPLFLPQGSIASLEVYDAATLEPVSYQLVDRLISFGSGDFSTGRVIALSYKNADAASRKIDVSHEINNILEVVNDASRACDPIQVGILGSTIDLTSCAYNDGDRVYIHFDYFSDYTNQFVVMDPRVGDGNSVTWSVLVNGVPTQDFTRVGTTITVNNLAASAQVVIKVSFPTSH